MILCAAIFTSLMTQQLMGAQAVKKPAAPVDELKTVPLVGGPAIVVANHVNVRSRASLRGEILTRMTNGEPVTVIEEVHLRNSLVRSRFHYFKKDNA